MQGEMCEPMTEVRKVRNMIQKANAILTEAISIADEIINSFDIIVDRADKLATQLRWIYAKYNDQP